MSQQETPTYDVIVVGGGAAGLLAAGAASQGGARTLLLEKMHKPALKIGITGKGRCNITNDAPVAEFITRFGANGRFLRQAFARFFSHDIITLLQSEGIEVAHERGGRVFAANQRATGVAKALVAWVRKAGVTILREHTVDRVILEANGVRGVETLHHGLFHAPCVIIATGGVSYPLTGSTGDGHRMATLSGHKMVPLTAALIPLESALIARSSLDGLHLVNMEAALYIDGKKAASLFGEMAFTRTGVTGPVILAMSAMAVRALHEGRAVSLIIDLKPALDRKKLDSRLLRDIERLKNAPLSALLTGLLPGQMIPFCTAQTGLDPDTPLSTFPAAQRKKLLTWLKACTIPVEGARPIAEAIVTAGGVSLREIDPKTMESRKVGGLYFAGEVLDLDAQTGGYNLQAAFSTGHAAGTAAAKRAREEV